ncbi:MAG: hypothetical protein AAF730_15995 [Bacteroidota bacterium]
MIQQLKTEVERLEAWALEHDSSEYPYSAELYSLVEWALEQPGLAQITFNLLLRALSLDDDAEGVQDLLREHPDKAERVATAAVSRTMDPRARWQVAVLAGEFAPETVLLAYLKDSDEYVRRRALLASRHRFVELAEQTALAWLDAPEEYSRMVALDTLHAIKSPMYSFAQKQLAQDESMAVRRKLDKLETGG